MSITIHPYIRISGLFEKPCGGTAPAADSLTLRGLHSCLEHEADTEPIVIVPSRGDRRIWLSLSGSGQRRKNSSESAPNKAMIWQDLYELICSELSAKKRRLISPPDHLLLLRGILKGIFSEESPQDGKGNLTADRSLLKMYPGAARSGVLDILSDDIRELLNEAVSPDELDVTRESCVSEKSRQSGQEALSGAISHLLPTVYRRYLNYLSKCGLLDSSQIWTAAKDLIKGSSWGRGRTIVFAGFMSFTHGQTELINALDENGADVVLLKPESGLSDFADVSVQFPNAAADSVSIPLGISAADTSHRHGDTAEPRSRQAKISLLMMPSAENGIEAEAVARGLALYAMHKGPFASFDLTAARSRKPVDFGRVGILTDEDGADDMRNALRRFGVPYVFSSGRKISRTPVGRILSAVRALDASDFPTRDTIFFLSQPCFAGGDFPAENALKSVDGGLAAWKAYLGRNAEPPAAPDGGSEAQPDQTSLASSRAKKISFDALRVTEEFLKTIKAGGTPCELMNSFRRFLTAKGLWLERLDSMLSTDSAPYDREASAIENRPHWKLRKPEYYDIDEYIRETASAIDTVREKAEALSELTPDIGPLKDEVLKGSDAFDFLVSWCESSSTRPPIGLSGAVHVYTQNPPVLASYDIWIMTDVTQKRWPGSMTESPLLGERERELLAENKVRLLSPADKTKQREALFRRMLFTGERLTILSRGLTDEKGRPTAESTLTDEFIGSELWGNDSSAAALPLVPISVLTDSKEKFEGIDVIEGDYEPTRDNTSKHKSYRCVSIDSYIAVEHDVRIQPELHFRSADPLSTSTDVPSVNVSDLKKLLCCPMRWLLERRIKIKEHTLEPVSSAEWGNIVHKLWETAWRRFRDDKNASFSEIVSGELNNMRNGSGVYEKDYRRTLRDSRFQRTIDILSSQILRLTEFQSVIIDRTRASGFIYNDILIENDLSAEVDGVRFSGRCDRTDILERDGKTFAVISDYKNGSAQSHERGIKDLDKYRWQSEKEGGGALTAISLGLQLSSYAKIFSESQSPGGTRPVGVCFLGLKDGEAKGTFDNPVYAVYSGKDSSKHSNSATIEKRIKEAEYAMSRAASIIKGGVFYPVYNNDTCTHCRMSGICRKAEFKGEEEFSINTDIESAEE